MRNLLLLCHVPSQEIAFDYPVASRSTLKLFLYILKVFYDILNGAGAGLLYFFSWRKSGLKYNRILNTAFLGEL